MYKINYSKNVKVAFTLVWLRYFQQLIISVILLNISFTKNIWVVFHDISMMLLNLRVLHTPGKKSAYRPSFQNYLKIGIYKMCLTRKWPPKIHYLGEKIAFLNLSAIHEIKIPAIFELGTCGLVDRSNTYCAI